MDIEQLQDAFRELSTIDKRTFVKNHMEDLREALGVSHQMLMDDVETDEIVTELLDERNMTISNLLDIFGNIDDVRDCIQYYCEDEYNDPYS